MSEVLFERLVEIVDRATDDGLVVRGLGGVGIHFHTRARGFQLRQLTGAADLDLATPRAAADGVERLLPRLGFEPHAEFNALFGNKRLLFFGEDVRQVDVFVDEFAMCHRVRLAKRLECERYTLALADLALTKLQVHELTHKDALDLASLLLAFEPTAGGRLELDVLADVLADDWGFFTTAMDNIEHLAEHASRYAAAEHVDVLRARVARLQDALTAAPKSLAWRLRARIGRRVPWYELPEENEFAAP